MSSNPLVRRLWGACKATRLEAPHGVSLGSIHGREYNSFSSSVASARPSVGPPIRIGLRTARQQLVPLTWTPKCASTCYRQALSTSSATGRGSSGSRATSAALALLASVSAIAFVVYDGRIIIHADTLPNAPRTAHRYDDDVTITSFEGDHEDEEAQCARKIRISELPEHDRYASTQWVVRGTKVYDITDFVAAHPGGEVVLRACGGSVDAYWKIITIHQKQEVYDILEQYYIGNIDERDLDGHGVVDWSLVGYEDIGDPFKEDPERDKRLIVHTAKPCNAETPGNLLTDFLTPLQLFFVRNHLWVPKLDAESHTLTIELSDGEETFYTLADLKSKFKEHTITATMQCAGNRRGHMSKSQNGPTAGLQWDTGAISTAEFTGVKLRDVLQDSGYDVDGRCEELLRGCCADQHVQLSAPGDTYDASIPLKTALCPTADVLLAWDMNGKPINRDHGGPLRAIVPGTIAARSVKWLGKVSISDEESHGQHQRRDYKVFPPHVKAKDVKPEDWESQRSIQEMPVQSAIATLRKDKASGLTKAQGWAFSGGGRTVTRVDVSADGGDTWKQAQLHDDNAKGTRRWAWTIWSAEFSAAELPKNGCKREFVVRAVDESYNSQPPTFDDTWNFRGLLASAWHRVQAP